MHSLDDALVVLEWYASTAHSEWCRDQSHEHHGGATRYSAQSGDLFGMKVRFVSTPETRADPFRDLRRRQQSRRFDDPPLAMHPLRLDWIEPWTLRGQGTDDDPQTASEDRGHIPLTSVTENIGLFAACRTDFPCETGNQATKGGRKNRQNYERYVYPHL